MWLPLLLCGTLAASPSSSTPSEPSTTSSEPSTVRPIQLELDGNTACEALQSMACELRPDCQVVKLQSPIVPLRDADGQVVASMGGGSTQVRCEPVEAAPRVMVLGVEAALCQDSGGTWRAAEGASPETCDCPASTEGQGRGVWEHQVGCGFEGVRCGEVGGTWDTTSESCTRGGRSIDARFARPLSEG